MPDDSSHSARKPRLSDLDQLAAEVQARMDRADAIRWHADQLHASVSAFRVVGDAVVLTVGKSEWVQFIRTLRGVSDD